MAAIAIPPTPTHYVTDTAHALGTTARAKLETELQAFDTTTGDQVIVWIGQTTGTEPLEQWTVDAAERWKAGRKGKDNGAVLFVFMQDHKIRIEVGYGLESKLTDAESARIISDTISPSMRSGDVDGAIQSGVDAMLTDIDPVAASGAGASSTPASAAPDPEEAGKTIFALVAVAFVLFLVILSLVRKGKKRGDWLDAFLVSGGSGGGGGSFGGGGFGGGGFSGGGGGFGGGGASGGW